MSNHGATCPSHAYTYTGVSANLDEFNSVQYILPEYNTFESM